MRRDPARKDWMRFRFSLLLIGILLAVGLIIVQAYRVQILHGKALRQEVQGIYESEVTLVPSRGSIFDRNGDDLAISIPVDSIYVNPHAVHDPVYAARKLAPILGLGRSSLLHKLKRSGNFAWLMRQVLPPVSERVKALGLSGIGVITENRRFYPNVELASHLLGFVGVDGKGLEGLEYQYDKLLRGKETRVIVDHDALRQTLAPSQGKIPAPSNGDHLVLTIHKGVQHVVEQYLREAVRTTGSKAGMSIVIEPRTGEILAMTSVPRFNPNKFSDYPQRVMRNRCVTDAYEPGSTFKPFMMSAALEEKILNPSDIIYCENGSFVVSNRTIHDLHRHRNLTPQGVLQQSSNIGAAKIGLSIGSEGLHHYIQRFGFGGATGVDLPGESSGMVRPHQMWTPVDLATISFGQGISATALQLAVGFATLANDGRRMRPYVVREVLDATGHTLKRNAPHDLGPVISPETAHLVTKMLTAVVSEKGTGARAAIEGFQVAGKTGTSQKPDLSSGGYQKGRYLASFAGFVPFDDPKLCVVVVLDEPKGKVYGGEVAAPVFRKIVQDVFGILGVTPGPRLLAQGAVGS